MRATIYDVAERAGVGIGTVSRTINNSPQIAPKTKEKVLKAIHELNYQPFATAQSLARKKTHMIAAIVPFITGYFYFELLKGIQYEVTQSHYDLILYSVDEISKTDEFLKKTLHERRVDGVLLLSMQISEKKAKMFLKSNIPIVLVDSYHPDLDSITVENKEGAYLATRHLIHLGHQKVAIIDAQLKSIPAKERLEGYQKALKDAGLFFNKAYLSISNSALEKDVFNREAGYEGMKRLLDLGSDRPTAVFISSDIQAAGAIKAIKEQGLKIPEDIAIVGFDDIELAEYLELSTMGQPLFEMGKLSVHRLLERLENPDLKAFKKQFMTHMVIRKSCGAGMRKLSA